MRAQIEHGLDEAGYGYWGFSPSDNPSGGTPHASFLALDYAPHAALDNLARLRSHFAVYGSGGFFDAVNVDSGQVAGFYLALDQGMAMAGAVNA